MSFFVDDIHDSGRDVSLDRALQRLEREDGVSGIETSMFESDEREYLAIPRHRMPSAIYMQDNTESIRQYYD